MDAGVLLLNFGEPPQPDRDRVVKYLERIFFSNAELDGEGSEEAARDRARSLAERRAPGLIEEYEEIGGSPLNRQADKQADRLEAAAAERGYDIETYVGMQFTDPLIESAAHRMAEDDIEHVIALPIYPLCGPSTTVAALDDFEAAVDAIDGWEPTLDEVTGWHRHPTYNRLRSEAIAAHCEDLGVALEDDDTMLVFSAHGTPTHYLEGGSRYDEYVTEYCETIAALLGVEVYEIGYQNHENRDIEWTEPEIEELVESLDVDRIVVDPISFVHEQSETLSELDIELREEATSAGLEFSRVPIPHDDPRFGEVFLDVIEPFLRSFDPEYYRLGQCVCRDRPGTVCLNAPNQ